MRHIFTIFCILCASTVCIAFPLSAAAAEGTVKVTKVDFYRQGALFTFECKAGDGGFTLDLPVNFTEISGGDAKKVNRFNWTPERLIPLKNEIKELERETDRISARESVLKGAIELALNQGDIMCAGSSEAALSYINGALERAEAMTFELSEIGRKRADDAKKLKALQAEFTQKMPQKPDSALRIEGRRDAVITAFCPDARWEPRYRLSLDTNSGAITGRFAVKVRQPSTFDVTDAELAFHTVRPSASLTTPELEPLRMTSEKEPPMRAMRSYAQMSMPTMNTTAEDAAEMLNEKYETTTAGLSLITTGSVAGDNTETEIIISESFPIAAATRLTALPELGKTVYIASETEPLETPFFGGVTQMVVDGRENGRVILQEHGEGERMKLTFGSAPLIRVKRTDVVSKSDSEWFGTSGVLDDGYDIKITNGMNTPQRVTVKDRVPVSTAAKVKVTNIKAEPKEDSVERKSIYTWTLDLKAGEERVISVRYRVTFPAEEDLITE